MIAVSTMSKITLISAITWSGVISVFTNPTSLPSNNVSNNPSAIINPTRYPTLAIEVSKIALKYPSVPFTSASATVLTADELIDVQEEVIDEYQ